MKGQKGGAVGVPRGQRDLSGARLSRHAVERFVERFGAGPDTADEALRRALARTRRLGRNPANGAVAALAVHGGAPLVAIFQGDACLTVLTWDQFEPRMAEFGRARRPRRWGRTLRRLVDPVDADGDGPDAPGGPSTSDEAGPRGPRERA